MRLKKWLAVLTLLVFMAGCSEAEPTVDNSAATAAHAALCERLETATAYKVELRTDTTIDGVRQINVTTALIKELAQTLAQAEVAEVELTSPGSYERHLGYTLTGGEILSVDYFRLGDSHADYPGRAVVWVDENGEDTQYLIDGETFDTAHALMEAATYTPEIPVSEFVAPLQAAMEGYRDGRLPPEGDKLYQPLPDDATPPDVTSTADFTVQEGGIFGYSVIVPMDGAWNMVADLAFFDGLGWEVAGVSFQRKSDDAEQVEPDADTDLDEAAQDE